MRITLLAVGLALASLSVAAPASAQRSSSRIDQNRGAASVSKRDPQSAIRATNAFGQCIAQRDHRQVRRGLELPLASREQVNLLWKNIDTFDECLGSSPEFDTMMIPPLLMAGAAAEWFVSVNRKRIDLAALAGMTDEALDKTDYKPRTDLEDVGLCVVRRNPENALALVLTRPTSQEEGAVIKAMIPDIGPCIPEGQQVQMNAPNLRAIVAYAIYRAASKLGAIGA